MYYVKLLIGGKKKHLCKSSVSESGPQATSHLNKGSSITSVMCGESIRGIFLIFPHLHFKIYLYAYSLVSKTCLSSFERLSPPLHSLNCSFFCSISSVNFLISTCLGSSPCPKDIPYFHLLIYVYIKLSNKFTLILYCFSWTCHAS